MTESAQIMTILQNERKQNLTPNPERKYYFKEKFNGPGKLGSKKQLQNAKYDTWMENSSSSKGKVEQRMTRTNYVSSFNKTETFDSLESEYFPGKLQKENVASKKNTVDEVNEIIGIQDTRPFTSLSFNRDSSSGRLLPQVVRSDFKSKSKNIISAATTSSEFNKTQRASLTSQKLRASAETLPLNKVQSSLDDLQVETTLKKVKSTSQKKLISALKPLTEERSKPKHGSISKFAEEEEYGNIIVFEESPRNNNGIGMSNHFPEGGSSNSQNKMLKQNSKKQLPFTKKREESFLEMEDEDLSDEEQDKTNSNPILVNVGADKPKQLKGTSYDVFWASSNVERQAKKINSFIYSRFILNFFFKEKKIINTEPNVKIKSQRMESFTHMIEVTKAAINDIIDLIPQLKQNMGERFKIESVILDIERRAECSKLVELLVCTLFVKGKILRVHRDFFKAIYIFKQCKNLSMAHKITELQMKCYKSLGKVYHELRRHQLALIYFTKALQAAWCLEDEDSELHFYDYIGVEHYYLCNLDKAKFFHTKMTRGEVEPKTSSVRILGVSKFLTQQASEGSMITGKGARLSKKQKKSEVETKEEKELFEISSGDEIFEFHMPSEQLELRNDNLLMESSEMIKKSGAYSFHSLHHPFKKSKKTFRMNPHDYQSLYKKIVQTADRNIRYKTIQEETMPWGKKFKSAKMSKATNPFQKEMMREIVLINQLSNVRSLDNFLNMESRETALKSHMLAHEDLHYRLEKKDLYKLRKIIRRFAESMHFAVSKFSLLLSKTGPMSRKAGFLHDAKFF